MKLLFENSQQVKTLAVFAKNARINVYKLIQKKQGQDLIKNVRIYEKFKTKSMKLKAGIIYIKSCKKDEPIPTFAKVNLAIKCRDFKIKKKITKLVMETGIQDKQYHLRKVRKDRCDFV